ncbi:hypothetical protein [Ponticoccus sp. (in: a-proteobacteria)]|uniref:hypothetical protein n=1 Tax=Ponticoccus sp. (in: a-proteobacteria) TaxID=1925025 RepID=UPI003AB288B6
MTQKIAFLTWGSSCQVRSFQDFRHLLDDLIHVRDLASHDLSRYAAVILPDRIDAEHLTDHVARLNDYVRGGGFLIVFSAETCADWLDVVDVEWRDVRIKDWLWWQKPGGRPEIHQPRPLHPICEAIPLRDMAWHWHGVLAPHPTAQSLLSLDDDSASLFLDFRNLECGGRLMISTLDPHNHNGQRFMPATTRFLEGFYPWLNRELGIDRSQDGFTLTYLQSIRHNTEWQPERLEEVLAEAGGKTRFLPLYDLSPEALNGTDILYIPSQCDEFFLRDKADVLLGHLDRGGHLLINAEPAISWLPFLGTFTAVSPRPFTNIKVRLRNDPFGMFANMDEDFDGWSGVFGQYARGWTPMPEGATWLTEVGTAEDPKPADWLWQYPSDCGKGGHVFMHNGDNLLRYPDHGDHRDSLVRDICAGLIRAGRGQTSASPDAPESRKVQFPVHRTEMDPDAVVPNRYDGSRSRNA